MYTQQDKKAKFISLEGTDGSGKSSLRRYITSSFWDADVKALSTGPHSFLLPKHSEIIVDVREGRLHSKEQITESYVLDKKEHQDRTIVPSIEKNQWIIADRSLVSDIVYHEVVFGIDPFVTYDMQRKLGVKMSDIIVFLDTPPDIAFQRINERQTDGFKFWETKETLKRLYDSYNQVLFSGRFPDVPEVKVIDNSGSEKETKRQVDQFIKELI
ncbi:deoxynucleoside kinase (plasmid) [Exiguobacterium sp. Helios]|uniref:dTMP kinase n=1 Tax=Exiguobacterium sp. Helios TaxID=2735868 RepID=UPI00165DB072|nr:deoxynucleoside kinase [Exiguobacterium sp. Helios]QNR22520.1 deoxynucleoside kinase [Exiguobacterium sp. Helios]